MQLHLTTSNNAAAITWTSSDSSVAEVTSDGLVTGRQRVRLQLLSNAADWRRY